MRTNGTKGLNRGQTEARILLIAHPNKFHQLDYKHLRLGPSMALFPVLLGCKLLLLAFPMTDLMTTVLYVL